ncbi:MAG: glycine zipper family protein [Myxococcota bacterium]
MRKTLPTLTALVILLTVGCAQRPVLYPNEHYNEVGAEAGEQDVKACIALAEAADLDTNQALEAGKRTAGGAVVGGASGAVAGVISGRTGFGAIVGAATGAIGGFFTWLFGASEPHPVYVSYVDTCLAERGYRTIGWK